MNATMKPTPARAAIVKASATPRSARFSALVPRIGKRSRRWTMCTPSASAPASIACSGVISRSSSSVGAALSSPWVVLTGSSLRSTGSTIISAPTPPTQITMRLGHRADAVDAVAAGVLGRLQRLDVG